MHAPSKTWVILTLLVASTFFGWVIAGIDSIWGSDYYSLDEQVAFLISLSPLTLVLASAWLAPNWRLFFPKTALFGILLGAWALGMWAMTESDVGTSIGIVLMALSVFGIIPYLVIALSLTLGVCLGKGVRSIIIYAWG